jgi:hypothetical protein
VALDPNPSHLPEFAYALVKQTYEMKDGAANLTKPAPLLYDVWHDDELEPRFPLGSDYWYDKPATDVVLHGSAYASGGRQFQTASVSVAIGQWSKQVMVFGHRIVEWSAQGTPRFTAPEPVASVPLVYQLAYGGLDPRVPIPEAQAEEYERLVRAGHQYDHPGLYPRNPVGKGYLALPGPVAGLELPNLEDPFDLLQPERLTAGAPELWHRQPLPWCLEYAQGLTFPRYRYLGIDAWHPAPIGPELKEVERGFMPPSLDQALQENPALARGYLQEASLGMVFPTPLAGQRVELIGVHAEEPRIAFTLPSAPRIEFEIEGQRQLAEARLTNLVLFPEERTFCMTYAAKSEGLPRVFVPSLHREIPLAVRVDADAPILYETPPTIRERLQNASPTPQ